MTWTVSTLGLATSSRQQILTRARTWSGSGNNQERGFAGRGDYHVPLQHRMKHILKHLAVLLITSLPLALAHAAVYQEPADFVNESFHGKPPSPNALWLTPELKAQMEEILGHPPAGMRVRYWQDKERTTWVLDEIGKERPITTGIVIKQETIERVRVLIFRESRGWEVRHDFFTDQFRGASMNAKGSLDRNIDGISGATLSVRAVEKLARVALLLDQTVNSSHKE